MTDGERIRVGDCLRFDPPLVAGPDPHPVSTGTVVEADPERVAIRLPGQRELFRGLRSDITPLLA